jgi:hypothetical protein
MLFAGPEFLLSPVYFVHLTSVVRSHCQLGNLSSTPPWLPPVTSPSLSNLRRWSRGTLEPLPCGCAHLCCSYWTPSACIAALTFSNSPSPTCPERQCLGTAALHWPPGRAPPLPGKKASNRNLGQWRRQSRLEMGVEKQLSHHQCSPTFPPPAAPATAFQAQDVGGSGYLVTNCLCFLQLLSVLPC